MIRSFATAAVLAALMTGVAAAPVMAQSAAPAAAEQARFEQEYLVSVGTRA